MALLADFDTPIAHPHVERGVGPAGIVKSVDSEGDT